MELQQDTAGIRYAAVERLLHHVRLIVALRLQHVLLRIIGTVMIKRVVLEQVLSGALVLVDQPVIVQVLHPLVRLIHATRQMYGTARLKRSVKQ